MMNKQYIIFTQANEDWLKERVASQEYASKSELLNHLVLQARKEQIKIDWINNKLRDAEQDDFLKLNKDQIRNDTKLGVNGSFRIK